MLNIYRCCHIAIGFGFELLHILFLVHIYHVLIFLIKIVRAENSAKWKWTLKRKKKKRKSESVMYVYNDLVQLSIIINVYHFCVHIIPFGITQLYRLKAF